MKSGLRRLWNAGKPPIPLDDGRRYSRGLSFNLGAGTQDRETHLRQYGRSGTLYGIVGLLAEAAATPPWDLYKKAPVDGRRRYTTGDKGSDQRVQVVQHAAIQLWNSPNDWHSGFEFREGAQQHQELTGETFWVLDTEAGFPTDMWYVRPDRMEPVPDPDLFLQGWIYTGPNGENVPLRADEVILEKRPDPLDPYRGAGPVASIMPNLQQQRYATEYQRNLFLNGADPGGVITVPNRLNDRQFDELIDRWRETHRGVARAGRVGVLEDGMAWLPSGHTNKDLEYGQLRLANRDELREAWRIHKSMMGTADDVNRANAQTAQEVFVAWQVLPRLNRRRDTLNNKLLPMFGQSGQGVEFDYRDPSPINAETAAQELLEKAQAAQALIAAGGDMHDVMEIVGLPDMAEAAVAPPAPVQRPQLAPAARESLRLTAGKDPAAKAIEQAAEDFPPAAMAWMYHATWTGPVKVPIDHIDWTPGMMDGVYPELIEEFVDRLQDGDKLKPAIMVKTPGSDTLMLIDGHHHYLAAAELDQPLRAYVGVVGADHGPWETMHAKQYPKHNGKSAAKNALPRAAMQWEVQASGDENTCQPCRSNDGKLYASRQAAYADYPGGGHYIHCIGEEHGNRCRCSIVKHGTSSATRRAVQAAATLTKRQVSYRPAAGADERCGTCAMFRSPHGCTLVKGVIEPRDVCDRWAAEAASTTEMASLLKRILSDGYMPIELGGRI